MLSTRRKSGVTFKNGRPSKKWLQGFLKRYLEFSIARPKETEDAKITALTIDTVAIHIERLKAAMSGYNIKRPGKVLNLDETGISFKPNGRRCKRKDREEMTIDTEDYCRTKNMDHLTVMSVMSVSGFASSPLLFIIAFRRIIEE